MNNEVVELRNQLQREAQSNKDLQDSLQQEKEKAAVLERSLTLLRRNYEAFHNQAEMEEEKFVNKLILKIDDLKKGKEKLAYELESEEEHITLAFQVKLSKMQSQLESRDREIDRLNDQVQKLRAVVKSQAEQLQTERDFHRHNSITSISSDRYSVCSSVEDV